MRIRPTWQGLFLTILLHFLRPWRSDVGSVAKHRRPTGMSEVRAMQEQLPRWARATSLCADYSTGYGSRCCASGLRSQRIANITTALRPSVHHPYHPLHGSGSGPVQRLLERLTRVENVKGGGGKLAIRTMFVTRSVTPIRF